MQNKNVEKPTIGRMVYVFTNAISGVPKDKPFAAVVANVDGLTINAMVIGHSGDIILGGAQHIVHLSEHEHQTFWWDWMPYQKGQAKKAEELETELQQMAKSVAKAANEGVDKLEGRIDKALMNVDDDRYKNEASVPSTHDGKR